MRTQIFVSYAREDEAPAGSIVNFLRSAGFYIWFDKDSLLAGQDWRIVIEQEIARSRLLLICLSKNSVDKTGFVQKEMRLALQQAELRPSSRVYIIPVSLDGCPVPEALQRWQVLDLRDQNATGRLLDAIQNATDEGARTSRSQHEALAAAIKSYNRGSKISRSSDAVLGEVAQKVLELIEQEPKAEERGIVEILEDVEPGFTVFFPRNQYRGSTMSLKTRLFHEAVGQLVAANILFPPELNPSANTRTYEYKLD